MSVMGQKHSNGLNAIRFSRALSIFWSSLGKILGRAKKAPPGISRHMTLGIENG